MSTTVVDCKTEYPIYKSGDRYGQIMLTGKSYMIKKVRMVEYICYCGNIGWASLYHIRGRHTKSCGCLAKRTENSFHGLSKHPLYKVFDNMKSRCYNPESDSYENYGGRGIFICKEWLDNFENFYNWAIGNGWEDGLTVERKNNDGIYETSNCKIATRQEQSENTRRSKKITAFGETKNISQWVKDERCKVSQNTIQYRMMVFGWDAEKSITTNPLNRNRE